MRTAFPTSAAMSPRASRPSTSRPKGRRAPRPDQPLGGAASTGVQRDGLSAYLEDIGRYPRLTREDERAMGRDLRSEDPEVKAAAQERLFLGNLRLVITVAKPFGRGRFELWDLVSVGNTGLWHAAGRYDERKNVPFSSYAAGWIKQRIMRHIPDEVTVPVPAYLSGTINKILRRGTQMQEILGRAPSVEELALDLNVPVTKVRDLMHVMHADVSFDTPVAGAKADGATLGERLGDSFDEADDRITQTLGGWDRRRLLEAALSRLPERQTKVLRWVYGFDTKGEEMDLDFIAQRLGVTRERVRQIKVDALKALARDPVLLAGLREMGDAPPAG